MPENNSKFAETQKARAIGDPKNQNSDEETGAKSSIYNY